MKDAKKTKKQLISELAELRQRVAALEKVETERKQAEDASTKSEERYKKQFEEAMDAILIADAETGIIVDCNRVASELVGREKSELVGKHQRILHPPEEIEGEFSRTFKQHLKEKEGQVLETQVVTEKGEIKDVAIKASIFELGGKKVILGIFRDITERKRAEREIEERRFYLEGVLAAAPDAIVTLDSRHGIVEWNQGAERLFGYSPEEVIGRNLDDLITNPDTYKEAIGFTQMVLNGKDVSPVESVRYRKDGSPVNVILAGSPVLVRDEVIGVVAVYTDITERKQAEKALRESEEKFRSLAERSPNMIFVNRKGKVVYANERCERVMGYTREEFYSPDFDFFTLIAPESRETVGSAFGKHKRGKEVEPYEYNLITKDGKRIEAIITTRLIDYEGERAILGIVTDITERKRAEKEIYRRSEELAALNAIAMTVTSTLDLQEVLQAIQERVMKLLGEKYPPIFALFDEGEQTFEVVLTYVQEQPLTRTEKLLGMKFEELALSLSTLNPAVRETLLAGKPYVTDDGSDLLGSWASRRLVQAAQRTLGVKCIVDLPLWVKGKLVGTMILFSQKEKMSDQEMELLSSIASQAAVAIENARAYQKLDEQNLQTISALVSAVEARDPYTSGHSQEVTEYAVAIAEKLGLPKDEIESLRWAGLLHDIGKIGVSDAVLSKPSRLTAAEYMMIKAHPLISAEIVGKMQGLAHLVPIIRHHHERYDGNGYPDGLKGEEIPLLARILAVADGFEAMTAERPYRFAKSQEEAREALKAGAGSQWDPQVVEAFMKMHKEGTLKHQAGSQ